MRQRSLQFLLVLFLGLLFCVFGVTASAVQVVEDDAALDADTHEVAAWIDDQGLLEKQFSPSGPWNIIEQFTGKATLLALAGLPVLNDDFWDRALAIRGVVTKYSYFLLDELAKSGLAKEMEHFKTAMHAVITWAGKLETDIQDRLANQGNLNLQQGNINEISAELAVKLQVISDELHAMFPEPDTAASHELRVNIAEHALTRVSEEFTALAFKLGMSEEQSAALQADFEKLKPHVRDVVVTVGDLAEQHPVILETLLFAGVGMLIPESWLLRPLLSLFGFGPYGPVKGSPAAWAQRVFFGAVVPEGSWFAFLQRAAMKAIPPNAGKTIVGGVLAGIGMVGSMFRC